MIESNDLINVPSGYIIFLLLKVKLKDFITPRNHWFLKYPQPLMKYLHFLKGNKNINIVDGNLQKITF